MMVKITIEDLKEIRNNFSLIFIFIFEELNFFSVINKDINLEKLKNLFRITNYLFTSVDIYSYLYRIQFKN